MKHLITIITVMGLMVTSGFGITRLELNELQKRYHMSEARMKEFSLAKVILLRVIDDQNRYVPEVNTMLANQLHTMSNWTKAYYDDLMGDCKSYTSWDLWKYFVEGEYRDKNLKQIIADAELADSAVALLVDDSVSLSEKEAYIKAEYGVYKSFIEDGIEFREKLDKVLHDKMKKCAPEFGGVTLCTCVTTKDKWQEVIEEDCVESVEVGM